MTGAADSERRAALLGELDERDELGLGGRMVEVVRVVERDGRRASGRAVAVGTIVGVGRGDRIRHRRAAERRRQEHEAKRAVAELARQEPAEAPAREGAATDALDEKIAALIGDFGAEENHAVPAAVLAPSSIAIHGSGPNGGTSARCAVQRPRRCAPSTSSVGAAGHGECGSLGVAAV